MKTWRIGILLLMLGPIAQGTEIRLVGSDLLSPRFVTALQDFSRRNEMGITMALEGSLTGWQALLAGNAEVGLLSFAPGEAIPAEPFYVMPLAYHAVMVLVPVDLPLAQVSFPQLAGVFGRAEGLAWKRWSDLGVMGAVASRSVMARALVPGKGVLLELFKYEVLQSQPLREGLIVDHSADKFVDQLLAGDEGMGLASLLPEEPARIKALPVSRIFGGVAYAPSELNIHRGDYPLRWPVYVVFRRENVRELYPLLRYLLGAEAARHFQESQLVPVPAAERETLLFDLEKL